MGVYINGMGMPKRCRACPLATRFFDGEDVCAMLGTYVHDRNREDDCPLIPVPPHGDLIDRDPFVQFIKSHWDSSDQWFVEQFEARPTIIPAEEVE